MPTAKNIIFTLMVGNALLTCSAVAGSLPALTFGEVEHRSLEYRRTHFKNGRVKLAVRDIGSDGKGTEFRFNIDFDGDSLRVDQTGRNIGGNRKWGSTSRRIVANGQLIMEGSQNPELVVTIDSASSYGNARADNGLFHPRGLGMSSSGINFLYERGIETLLGRADRLDEKISQELLNGLGTYRLEYKSKNGVNVSLNICPEQGYGVVRARTTSVSNGVEIVQQTDSQLKAYGKQGVWFPEKCDSKTMVNSKTIDQQEIVVEEAVFGEVPDPETFTLAGLGLKVGRPINDSTREYFGVLLWDGTKAVPDTSEEFVDLTESGGSTTKMVLLLANAALCALLAGYLIWRKINKSKTA